MENNVNEKPSAKAILSMIFGIVSLSLCWGYGGGIIFGIISLVFSKSGNVNARCKGFCKAGKIMSIIGIVVGALFLILIIAGVAVMFNSAPTYSYRYYY